MHSMPDLMATLLCCLSFTLFELNILHRFFTHVIVCVHIRVRSLSLHA